MVGVVAPTDSRFRNDVRYLEEGKLDEADEEKLAIEIGQRKRRKQMEEAISAGRMDAYKPKFFVREDHPYFKDNEVLNSKETRPIRYRYVENDGAQKSYWERREKGDWADMERLWGPFE